MRSSQNTLKIKGDIMQNIILEIVANAMDMLVWTLLFTRRLLPKYNGKYPTIIFLLLGLFIESIPVVWNIPYYPTEIIMTVYCLLYLFFFRQGKVLHKLFWYFLSCALLFAIALTSGTVISAVASTTSVEIFSQTNFPLRVLYIVVVNIIKFTLFYLISTSKRKIQSNSKAMALCLMIPIISVVSGIWIWTLFLRSEFIQIYDNIILLIAGSYLLINLLSFLFYDILEKDAEEKMYLVAKQGHYDIMEQYTEQIKETNCQIRVWQHDMKQHLNCMNDMLRKNDVSEAVKYLEKLTDSVKGTYLRISSGNYIADAVLSSKISVALEHGVAFECKASLPENLPIDDVDFCSMLSNVLENALEACERITDKPFIRCNVEKIKSQLIIEVENSSDGNYKKNGNVFESLKEKGMHGIGLRHTQSIIEKYEGLCSINAEENIFKILVSIPLKDE